MFKCHVCTKNSIIFVEKNSYISHLRQHCYIGDKIYPVNCPKSNCTDYFYDLNHLSRHIKDKHKESKDNDSSTILNLASTINQSYQTINMDQYDTYEQISPIATCKEDESDTSDNLFESIKNKIEMTILSLKARSNVSDTLTNEIIKSFQSVINAIF